MKSALGFASGSRLKWLTAGGISIIVIGTLAGIQLNTRRAPDRSVYEGAIYTLNAQGQLTRRSDTIPAERHSLTVPENRRNVKSRTIDLPITRIKSTGQGPSAEPIFWLGGGPGSSNMTTFRADYFSEKHDNVMVGYRGVDGSVSLDCPEISDLLKTGSDLLSDESLKAVNNAYAACESRLKKSGVDIDGYTILDVVDDIEAARQQLGYSQIHLVGESYGTRVAYLYALKYPEHAKSLVLIGANPPGHFVWEAKQSDELLKHYTDLWAKDGKAHQRCPDLYTAIQKINQNLPTHWLGLPINPGMVKVGSFTLLFHRDTASIVLDAYCAAANGDPSGLWAISLATKFILPSLNNWGEFAAKAVSADYDPTRNYKDTMPSDAVLGAPLSYFAWQVASSWTMQPIPDNFRKATPIDTPVLILSGNLDFSTPAENATKELLPLLKNGKQVIVQDAGHVQDLWQSQPQATQRLLTTFIDNGTVDDSGFQYLPPKFDVPMGMPTIAKLIVFGIPTVVIVLLIILIVVFRQLRNCMLHRKV